MSETCFREINRQLGKTNWQIFLPFCEKKAGNILCFISETPDFLPGAEFVPTVC